MNTEPKECERLYYTLLTLTRDRQRGSLFVRELMETKACDTVFSLADLRSTLVTRVGADGDEGRLPRIIAFEETPKDKRVAVQALIHHRLLLESTLQKAIARKA
jgi:hypothetical protein